MRPVSATIPDEPAGPPFRLRYVLLLLLIGAAAAYATPRARALWRLHSAAATFADYALCMVGPTGPTLLRDDPPQFWKLARRRLIAAPADAHPFEKCANAARELSGSVDLERGHREPAARFVEYGSKASDRAASGSTTELGLSSIEITSRVLSHLAEEARPFAPSGYTNLVRASTSAREAVHPVELPRPVLARGLPPVSGVYRSVTASRRGLLLATGYGPTLAAYRSTDGGITWRSASLSEPGLGVVAGRCAAGGERAFLFGRSADQEMKTVRVVAEDGSESVLPLAPVNDKVLSASCDRAALVALVGKKHGSSSRLHVCSADRGCWQAPLPPFDGAEVPNVTDVARVDGATIVVATRHGIVRVASSRDDGVSWTPWTVAFDAKEFPDLRLAPPDRLLVAGARVLLFGGAKDPASSHALLVSHDQGASFRSE